MQFVLSITHKPATSGGSTGADSGYSYQSGDMQWDVEVNAGYDTFAGMLAHFDASNPGNPPGGDTPLDKGVRATEKALLKDSCADLFKDISALTYGLVKTPKEYLDLYLKNNLLTVNKIQANGVPFRDAGVGASTGAGGSIDMGPGQSRRTSYQTRINPDGFFFSGRNSEGKLVSTIRNSGFYGLDQNEIRAAVIIHELLHSLGLIPNDGPDLNDNGEQSRLNSEAVRKACF